MRKLIMTCSILIGGIIAQAQPVQIEGLDDPEFIALEQKCERISYEFQKSQRFPGGNVTSEYSSEGLDSDRGKRTFLSNECKDVLSTEKLKEISMRINDEINEELELWIKNYTLNPLG